MLIHVNSKIQNNHYKSKIKQIILSTRVNIQTGKVIYKAAFKSCQVKNSRQMKLDIIRRHQ